MRYALARKTNFESFARSIFYAIDSRRFLPCCFFFYRITSRITSRNFVHPLDIFKFNFLLKNTGNRKMPSTTTKCLGFKCQPYFSPQISLNFNLERLSPCYWPYNWCIILLFSSVVQNMWSTLLPSNILFHTSQFDIRIHFLLIILCAFPKDQTWRIGLTVKSFLS